MTFPDVPKIRFFRLSFKNDASSVTEPQFPVFGFFQDSRIGVKGCFKVRNKFFRKKIPHSVKFKNSRMSYLLAFLNNAKTVFFQQAL